MHAGRCILRYNTGTPNQKVVILNFAVSIMFKVFMEKKSDTSITQNMCVCVCHYSPGNFFITAFNLFK
jgi:hypothetical protein